MAKYVELEDVIQRLDNAIYCANRGEFDSYLEAMKRLRIAYDETMPTIEIVRCKDCKYYLSDGGAIMECEIYEVPTEENHYCGYGADMRGNDK